MTEKQKEIVIRLLAGGSITGNRLRDASHNPLMKISPRTFYWLKMEILRRLPNGMFVVNKSKIRRLHGNSWIKRTYKESASITKNYSTT